MTCIARKRSKDDSQVLITRGGKKHEETDCGIRTLRAAMVVGSATGCSTASSKETEKAPAADTTTAAGGQADTTAAPETEAAKADLKGNLVFAIWDNNLMDYIDQNDMVGKFQEKYPDAEIEGEDQGRFRVLECHECVLPPTSFRT